MFRTETSAHLDRVGYWAASTFVRLISGVESLGQKPNALAPSMETL